MSTKIIDFEYYYNPDVKCTCGAIFADAHRDYCHRRIKPKPEAKE